MSARPGGPDHRWAGDDDREAAVRRVREAYAEGHIPYEELDGRLHRVLTATTRGELASALDPLPGQDAGTTSTITAAGGRIRRRGAWRVPRTLRIESPLARVHLDLSRAVIEHPVVDIEVHLGTGGATITVPRDAVVDLEDLRAGWRQPLHRARRRPRPGGPRIRVSGTMGTGRLTVRHAWW
ncbi:DUF1707 domain-containing protein [Streptosporangium sp. NPDC050855]|uniref:DUF1707 domain-containing protein n=1 Tax=Streptosporangium sp. NPDC050855 TaxID=3366194 RepID=UPI0037B92F8E